MDLTLQWTGVPASVDDAGCVVEFRLDGAHEELDERDVGGVPFERCESVRVFSSWRGKRHYDGHFWMSRLGRSVAFESLVERSCLSELDRLPTVVGVSSQPMWISWGEGGVRRQHAPDFFARLADGSGAVVDVRPTDLIDERAREQFDRTAAFCARVGWRYVVFEGLSRVRDANLRFLNRYRILPDPDEIPDVPAGGASLAVVAAMLTPGPAGLAACYHLIWSGVLSADLERPLAMTSVLTRGVTVPSVAVSA